MAETASGHQRPHDSTVVATAPDRDRIASALPLRQVADIDGSVEAVLDGQGRGAAR